MVYLYAATKSYHTHMTLLDLVLQYRFVKTHGCEGNISTKSPWNQRNEPFTIANSGSRKRLKVSDQREGGRLLELLLIMFFFFVKRASPFLPNYAMLVMKCDPIYPLIKLKQVRTNMHFTLFVPTMYDRACFLMPFLCCFLLEPTTHADDEYARGGVFDPKILITTSRDPSSRLQQFSKVM